jgi:hypothetical protein
MTFFRVAMVPVQTNPGACRTLDSKVSHLACSQDTVSKITGLHATKAFASNKLGRIGPQQVTKFLALWKPKVHYRGHESPPPDCISRHTNIIRILVTRFCKIHFKIIRQCRPNQELSLPSTLPSKFCLRFLSPFCMLRALIISIFEISP